MATSDVFKIKTNQVKVFFRIVGGGINLPFVMEPSLYDESTMEQAAIDRAKNIGCSLERYNPLRDKYEKIYSPRGGMVVLPEIDTNAPYLGVSGSNKNMPMPRH